MNQKVFDELNRTFRNADFLGLEEESVDFDSLTEEEKREWVEISSVADPRTRYKVGHKRRDGTRLVCEVDDNTDEYTKNCRFVPDHLLDIA